MAIWHDSSSPLIIPAAEPWAKPMTIQAELGTGTVSVQLLGSDGTTWATPSDPAFSIDSALVVWERANGPRMRIVATGNAKFSVKAD